MIKTGLLVGKKEIRAFLGDVSDYVLKKYMEIGMPVVIEDNRWLAHKDNIEEFFKIYTRRRKCDNVPAAMTDEQH